ncbi:hypothetical protein [Piscirickettsia litoralis]|uniref:DUF2513 domain-containing protein n=1 Tax=Piscirickettsia litoralis TaxID=1891921 RepID=A0ABX2ZXA6_9GAMM|nr:hypothetical protein [Piscirickettsia litoralis]ODN41239.1 hypothetical protein BGC07_17650 [Piscirickettsia litoralis]
MDLVVEESNIELFHECVSIIFAELYKNFPIAVPINALVLLGVEDVRARIIEIEQWKQTDHKEMVMLATLKWLLSVGYILSKSEHLHFGSAAKMVLSPVSLEALKVNVFPNKEEKKSIGDKLINAVASGGKKAMVSLSSAALSTLATTGTSQLINHLHL